MQTLLDYALAFGADIGAAKILQWTSVSNGHQHGHILDMDARMAGHFAPVNAIHQYVCQLNCQLIAHHYCSHFNQDVRQCILFMNSDRPDHSHVYEVKSDALVAALGVPNIVEKEVMKELIHTYGKTFHTWQIDRDDSLPLGVPQLI
ncbi:unnamed protein product [Rotaria sp. Silwood1]|nr:unnamed protein product [Rotaria sp. Silwood1]CAF5107210.1 unnamed protein product [Rotaria sp. Silwood1]